MTLNKTEEQMREVFEQWLRDMRTKGRFVDAWGTWNAAIAHANSKHSAVIEDRERLVNELELQRKATQIALDGADVQEHVCFEQLSAANSTIALRNARIKELEEMVAMQSNALNFVYGYSALDSRNKIVIQKAISATAETVAKYKASQEQEPEAIKQWADRVNELNAENAELRKQLEAKMPEGWQLTPTDPTPEMIAMADRVDWSQANVQGNYYNLWHLMIAAAPQPSKETT